ncbi:DEAD/DEAH box helicase [Paenibacillus sp. alder61]|nr:DEAD/DEAH box helicase [Paenibacillus sp. alder61]MCA1293652.1 DEAD/DEAH box helicase [Paenibacillus sp. alder61]
MSIQLPIDEIKAMCGTTSYQRGVEYYRAGRVVNFQCNEDEGYYSARVKGSGSKLYDVSVYVEEDEVIEADCNCPAFLSSYYYCKHVGALLLAMKDANEAASSHPDPWMQRMSHFLDSTASGHNSKSSAIAVMEMISLFKNNLQPSREVYPSAPIKSKDDLQLEYFLKLTNSYQGGQLFLEMKVGVKRLYVVQKIKQFLKAVELGQSMVFTKLFSYDPEIHRISEREKAVLNELIEIMNIEEFYRSSAPYYISDGANARAVAISPQTWARLAPMLEQVNCLIQPGMANPVKFHLLSGPLPLEYKLDQQAKGKDYMMRISNLNDLILLPAYEIAGYQGAVYKLEANEVRLLSMLKSTLNKYLSDNTLHIPVEQIAPFVQTVVPGLRKIGNLSIGTDISGRIVEPKLYPKLYLDIQDEVLTARLELDYEGTIIVPDLKDSVPTGQALAENTDQILMRDIQAEQRLIGMLDQSPLKRSDNSWSAEGADVIYEMLFYVLPRLEDEMEIYLSSAVKSMFTDRKSRPRIKADLGSNLDWLEISFELDGVDEKELRRIMRSIVEKKKYYRLSSGAFLSLEEEEYASFGQMADQLGLGKTDLRGNKIKVPAVRALQLPDRGELNKSVSWGKALRKFLNDVRDPERMEFEVPEELGNVLRDYQVQGFQWLKMLAHYRFGGILADDMGLGKTLQSIAYIVSERQEAAGKERTQTLIVAPSSLTYNWENEFARFAPDLRVLVVAGLKAERNELLKDIDEADVIVTSYPLLRRDIEVYRDRTFASLILDEAQAIKNAGSQTAQAVKELQATRKFALTGTPIENSMDELWSIFDAVFPGLFPSQPSFRQLSSERVSRMVRPFILRRMKKDVLTELPDKIETVQRPELTPEQKKLYAAYLAKLQEDTAKDLAEEGFQKSRMKILAGITRLRQLCCHPALFVEGYTGDSGKMQHLEETIGECLSSGKRLLVFSQFSSMLQLIRARLEAAGRKLFYLDGQTPAADRVDICRRFNEGEGDIFLISLKAGGTGLNLTGADTVILYDLWWNPAVEEQAIGRAHRMGQKHVVQVIRLVTEGTIEEKMLELQKRKKDLIEEVIESNNNTAGTLTEEDIRELLMV